MPVDPSILLGIKQPEIQNPLDAMGKMMAYKSLATRSQTEGLQAEQAQQEFNDNQAMRSAYANNTTVGPDGQVTFNRAGMLKDLATTSPSAVAKASQGFASMDMEMQNAKIKNMTEKLGAMGQILGGVKDQSSYDQALQQAKSIGADTSIFPPQYDPGIVQQAQMKALSAKDQYETLAKQRGMDIQGQELGIKRQELALSLQKNHAEQVQQTLSSLQSARGNPAVQQAERDLYSNAKVNKLVGDGDPNNLNMTKVRLLAGEVGKIATGGAPTLDELSGLTPKNTPQWLSEAAEKFNNKPTAANAGAFVKSLQNYSNGVAEDAKDLMRQNYQGIIESKKPWLPADSYQTLNKQFMGRLNGEVAPGSEWSATGSKPSSATKSTGVMDFHQWKQSQGQAAKSPKGGNGS